MVTAFLVTAFCIVRKPITVIIDGQAVNLVTYNRTVGEALEAKKISIGLKDKIYPALDTKLSKKDTITIKRAVNVTIAVDGTELSILSSEDTIDLMLKSEGIEINEIDKIIPEIQTNLSEGLKVEIIRVVTKTYTDIIPIDFKTVIRHDNNLSNTQRRTSQEGRPGEKHIVTDITYENDQEVSRKLVSETVAKEPVDKIIVQGTYPVMPISRGGDPVPYTNVFKAKATAYWPFKGIGKSYTASGRLAVRNPEGFSTIAVDPKVIPYGTRLFVENYGFAIAADTGTAIVGNAIDVLFNTPQEAMKWGIKYVNVYILK